MLITTLLIGSMAAAAAGCEVKAVDFKGWKAQSLSNPWVTVILVPQIGGRVMQVTFGNHDYLWVNERFGGQVYTPAQSFFFERWFNYGGDKIWPMPEGKDDEQHWPSAVASVLDGGAFSFEVLSKRPPCAVRMVGPKDPHTGLQYTREIAIDGDSPEIRFKAIMKNVTGYPLRWSEQSVSQYNVHDPKNPADYNHDVWGFTPANPRSAYPNGYHVRTGQPSNPAYAIRDGLFAVHFGDQGGEVWIDSPSDPGTSWVAVVDGATDYTMVERFHYERAAEYPDKATVIFYTTGLPRPRRGPPPERPSHGPPLDPPHIYYMEAEINSPMVELEPGESYTMRTEWFPTRMGRTFKTATYAGVVGTPLTVSDPNAAADAMRNSRTIALAGEFGVFVAGQRRAAHGRHAAARRADRYGRGESGHRPRRDDQHAARRRHRQQDDDHAAAERPQLHRSARPAARRRPGQLHQRDRRRLRQSRRRQPVRRRTTRERERLHGEWRQRPGDARQRHGDHPEPRLDRRVPPADERLRRRVRPLRRRPGQRDHPLGRQSVPRLRVRVLAQRAARREQLLQQLQQRRQGRLQAQSGRRDARRTDRARQDLLLRRLSGDA